MVNVLTTLYCIILQIVRNVSHVDEANIMQGWENPGTNAAHIQWARKVYAAAAEK